MTKLSYDFLENRDVDKVQRLLDQGVTLDEIIKWDLALKMKCEPKGDEGLLKYVPDEPIDLDKPINRVKKVNSENGMCIIVGKKMYDFLTKKPVAKLKDMA